MRQCWAVIAVCVFLAYNMKHANANNDIVNITEFHEMSVASQRASLKMTLGGELVPILLLRNSIKSRPLKLMVVFNDDVCASVFDISGGEGDGTARFTCSSGAIMRASFSCRNTCYFRGNHSQKGNWTHVYRYNINQNLSLQEVLEFAGYREAIADQSNSNELLPSIKQEEQRIISKLDKAKSICTELGFTVGTEKHGECVLKIMDN
ncbi:MAG: hypothetical protein ACON5C_08870 [Alphaproteobacteria bacterium]